jgi:hypothetical protein
MKQKIELIKYRDAGMQTYTYFWKNENNNVVSPYFDSEAEAMDWTKEKPEPRILDDDRAFDEAWAEMERKQTWKDS